MIKPGKRLVFLIVLLATCGVAAVGYWWHHLAADTLDEGTARRLVGAPTQPGMGTVLVTASSSAS